MLEFLLLSSIEVLCLCRCFSLAHPHQLEPLKPGQDPFGDLEHLSHALPGPVEFVGKQVCSLEAGAVVKDLEASSTPLERAASFPCKYLRHCVEHPPTALTELNNQHSTHSSAPKGTVPSGDSMQFPSDTDPELPATLGWFSNPTKGSRDLTLTAPSASTESSELSKQIFLFHLQRQSSTFSKVIKLPEACSKVRSCLTYLQKMFFSQPVISFFIPPYNLEQSFLRRKRGKSSFPSPQGLSRSQCKCKHQSSPRLGRKEGVEPHFPSTAWSALLYCFLPGPQKAKRDAAQLLGLRTPY
ncbi:hypothetical protein DV515_00006042 [Chloebia gouldiae]|uniref:Aftiphilin clathrin-binding box domain-containing protein n=1 Tax=Chloebia gouldiae TaxID=44316 RepID=A0A3L8SLX2_CHLGU|nr:hypothetical protein DV515_00006042 [Chloebia gouldiae]